MAYHRGDRTPVASAPFLSRPEAPEAWDKPSWWVAQAAALPEINCVRCPEHGPAPTYYTATFAGRVLGRHCLVCGWDQPVIVQEGGHAPQAPSTANAYELRRMRPPRTGWRVATSSQKGKRHWRRIKEAADGR